MTGAGVLTCDWYSVVEASRSSPSDDGNVTARLLHRLVFDVSSVSRDEDIYLAELRLVTPLVHTDDLHDRRVTVDELGPATGDAAADRTPPARRQIASKLVGGRTSGWETFTVTEAVKRWVKLRSTAQVVHPHI